MDLKAKLQKITSEWVQATNESFTRHPLAELFRQAFKSDIENLVKAFEASYIVNASVGAGNWANVPWLSILNPRITKSTQDGVYPVYLFKADGSGFYLSLNQGTTTPTSVYGKKAAEARSENIRKEILGRVQGLKDWGKQEISLSATTSLGKSYEKFNIIAKYYDANNIPGNEELEKDLHELLSFYKQVEFLDIMQIVDEPDSGLTQAGSLNASVNILTNLSKPFLLLAGISGTGKTRFVREQAKATGNLAQTYCLTPVRPDWHEPSDLLGYISRLKKDGEAEYIATDVLRFIAKAWRAQVDAGLSLSANDIGEGQGSCLSVSGEMDQLSSIPPFWLCLDEMNLAPVEQYFADYLSILETREWRWDGESFEYFSDPLLTAGTIQQLEGSGRDKLRKDLGFEHSDYNELWSFICEHGMGIPFNLIVAGTVNMDETTHGFSRKVIDRALSFDFGEFFPNDFATFFKPITESKQLNYPIYSHANKTQEKLPEKSDPKGLKSIEFLNKVNAELQGTPFELAYRALNELLLAVICTQPEDDSELQAVWDDFLMCKVLPRIEGDADKLGDAPSILQRLEDLLANEFSEIWSPQLDDKGKLQHPARPDLYREYKVADGATDEEKVIRIACRSKSKIQWMQQRLISPGFTSFWP